VPKKAGDENFIQIEATRDAIRDSIERAHELICEAKQRMARERAAAAPVPAAVSARP
jgi:hypothetical protein